MRILAALCHAYVRNVSEGWRGLLYHYNLTSEERGTKTTPVQNPTYLETVLFTLDIA